QSRKILINDQLITTSIIVTAEQLIFWRPANISTLETSDCIPLLSLKPAIVLIGTGMTLIFPPLHTYGILIDHHIGVEIMNTSAACRTYTALTAEKRNVAAALVL